MALSAGDSFNLPNSKTSVSVLRVEENIMQMGPAIKLRIVLPNKDIQFWVFQYIDEIKAANPGLFAPFFPSTG
jgi:cytochrome c biogenesis protein